LLNGEMNEREAQLPQVSDDDLLRFVDRLYDNAHDFDVREVFLAAVDAEEILRLCRQRISLEAVRIAPEALNVLREKVLEGNVSAIKLLFNIIGSDAHKSDNRVAISNQIVISDEERMQLARDYMEMIEDERE